MKTKRKKAVIIENKIGKLTRLTEKQFDKLYPNPKINVNKPTKTHKDFCSCEKCRLKEIEYREKELGKKLKGLSTKTEGMGAKNE
jgi:hypothetical protein